MNIKIYTDGGCQPNPGNGAWAWALDTVTYDAGTESDTTNNRMELTAIIRAIQYVNLVKEAHGITDVVIYSDSQYCVNGFMSWMYGWEKRGWKKKGGLKNVDLWQELFSIREGIKLEWVRGHDGNKMNEFVDELAAIESM